MRIALMVIRLILLVPYYFARIWWYSLPKNQDYREAYRFIRKAVIRANKAGRVRIEAKGLENLPAEDGFVMYPNHQGMFDVLAVMECCEKPFAFVSKIEALNLPLVKQVIKALGSIGIDRADIRQSMGVIAQMTDEVRQGRNFLIFAEGTRNRDGNCVHEFKGGSFKAAQRAKSPIVPVALVDAYKPFDESSIRPLTVKVIVLPALTYEQYKDMKTVEIAQFVREAIEEAIRNEVRS